ncbi:very-long-chain (3R)-3-hydroxyacyl-CoA dehydratase 4 isoform X2 [Boleophthalmus pectinirostris]|uniref:very-long-chain (3R)-3-hydroxyacyl-CoA dehydratase 4 isoform X2 n=1 Tax=Boleophthalmus pectinirostris TaxID=150288 RepID=UPI00242D82C2|nr:very-long-chain (3R)-3-hydroxyacyl-CoA dehydratase 4 isoform X2 [Boleophthalmus pectinirostris]
MFARYVLFLIAQAESHNKPRQWTLKKRSFYRSDLWRDDPAHSQNACFSRLSFRLTYIFVYNLLQFCGHTWILTNTIARFLTFGKDALADTFYSVGFVMSLCQLLSFLELFHIADGIEKARLLPRFIQVTEKNVLLIMVILLEEMQSKPVVCLLFLLWNIQDLLRYPHELLCAMDRPSVTMLWTRYTLWIPLYALSVATEGFTLYQALPHISSVTPPSDVLNSTVTTSTNLHFVVIGYLTLLALGGSVSVWQLLKERKHHLDKWNKKKKTKLK